MSRNLISSMEFTMEPTISYRFLKPNEEEEVCALVEEVFNRYVAPDYPQEGIEEFFRFANPGAMQRRSGSGQIVLVAEQSSRICGMLEIRDGSHLSLMFVKEQGKGIARNLLNMAIRECLRRTPGIQQITVNSSPYAEIIYQRLGFIPTGPSQTIKGITFIPMTLSISQGAKQAASCDS
jgi:GNAT superfamily N-acetyltransferase